MTKRCPNCSVVNPDSYHFCDQCGSQLAVSAAAQLSPPVPSVICRGCGAANRESVRFCEQCGVSLGEDHVSGAAVVPPPWRRRFVTKGRIAAAFGVLVVGGGIWAGLAFLGDEKSVPGTEEMADATEEIAAPQNTPDLEDVSDLLAADAGLADFNLHPNQGLKIDTDDGREVTYEDGHLDYTVTTNDGTEIVSRIGNMAGWFTPRDNGFVFEFDPDVSPATIAWAEWVLEGTTGVDRAGAEWVIQDTDLFVSQVLSADPQGGNWVFDSEFGLPGLLDAAELRFLYYWPDEGHTWVVDNVEDKAWLATLDGSGEIVIAGVLVDDGHGVEFREESGLDSVARESVNKALADFPDGALALPAFGDGALASSAHQMRAMPASYQTDGRVATAIRYGWCMGVCGFVEDNIIEPAKNRVVDPVLQSGRKYIPVAVEGVVDFAYIGPYEAGIGVVTLDSQRVKDGLTKSGDGLVTALKASLVDFQADLIARAILKDCGTPGPGPNSDGSGRPEYPDEYNTVLLPQLEESGAEGEEWQQRDLLARAWMPGVKLSEGERCGEIARISADVALFGPDGEAVERLAGAARVQITYTLFYAEDGGVVNLFGVMALGGHPGDNEGFSVGLVRSERSDGRCGLTDPHFELVGGKSAAHKNWGIFRATSDVIGLEWSGGNPCPAAPASWDRSMRTTTDFAPQTPDHDYKVWSSLNKHGTYFHKSECDLGLLLAEECIEGRGVYDLHHWVELVITDISDTTNSTRTSCPNDSLAPGSRVAWPPPGDMLHHGGFDWDGKDKPYYCLARQAGDGTGKYDVPGIRTADYAAFPIDPTGFPQIRTETECGSRGQTTHFWITGMYGNTDISVLVVDDSTILPTVLVDLSGTTDLVGNFEGSFDWGANSIYLDEVRIDVSQSTWDESRHVDVDVPAIAGCWPPTEEHSLAVTPSGSGSVWSSPGGIDCGSDCSHVYEDGTVVTLTASPLSGSVFVGWSGACSGTGTCVVTMDGDRSVTANFEFESPDVYTLTVVVDGSGAGSVSSDPYGIDCGSDCSHQYEEGTTVSLSATPWSGWDFLGWSGACSGTGSCVVTMDGDRSVVATFGEEPVTNHPPEAVDLYWTLDNSYIGEERRFTMTTYVTDPDGDPISLSDTTCNAAGCEMLEQGPWVHDSDSISVTVRAGGTGTVTIPIEYEVTDGRGGYDTATFYLTVEYPSGSEVPDVIGLAPMDAESELWSFGFGNVRHECHIGYSGIVPEVVAQDPAPGMEVPTSALITLVSEGDPDYSGWWPSDCNWVERVTDSRASYTMPGPADLVAVRSNRPM